MPASESSENARNAQTSSARLRRYSPTTTPTSASVVSRWTPTSRASRGARAPQTAKASTGSEVNTPASAGDMPRPSMISSRTGPTLTADGRRLKARATIPTTTSTRANRPSSGGEEADAADTGRFCQPPDRRRSARRRCPVGHHESVRRVSDDERRGRLARRHALAPRARAATVEAAVEAMTCLHATEPANVYLSGHARSGATREDIERALFHERTVVRQLAMRRTVFAFPRGLLPAVWGSASARVAAQLGARLAKEVEAAGLAPDGPAWLREVCAAVLAELGTAPATTT